MKNTLVLILVLALGTGTLAVMGCTSEEIKEEVEDYRRAKESAKRSMVDKPVEHTPVGDPWPTVDEGPKPDDQATPSEIKPPDKKPQDNSSLE